MPTVEDIKYRIFLANLLYIKLFLWLEHLAVSLY